MIAIEAESDNAMKLAKNSKNIIFQKCRNIFLFELNCNLIRKKKENLSEHCLSTCWNVFIVKEYTKLLAIEANIATWHFPQDAILKGFMENKLFSIEAEVATCIETVCSRKHEVAIKKP